MDEDGPGRGHLCHIDTFLVSISFVAKCLRVEEDGHGQGHLCHIDTFLLLYNLYLSI